MERWASRYRTRVPAPPCPAFGPFAADERGNVSDKLRNVRHAPPVLVLSCDVGAAAQQVELFGLQTLAAPNVSLSLVRSHRHHVVDDLTLYDALDMVGPALQRSGLLGVVAVSLINAGNTAEGAATMIQDLFDNMRWRTNTLQTGGSRP